MSAAIKELETALGATLIDRTTTGAELTPVGRHILARAQTILADAEDLSHLAQHAQTPLSGQLRLGMIPTIAPYVLPGLVTQLRTSRPALDLSVHEDVTDRLCAGLRTGTLDVAVIALPTDHTGVTAIPAFEDEFLLAAPVGDPLLTQAKLDVADIAPERLLLLSDGHCLRNHVLTVCGHGPQPNAFAATSLTTVFEMVSNGLGLTLAPALAVRTGNLPEGVAVRQFSPALIGRQVGLAWRAGSSRAEDAAALRAVIANQHASATH